MQSCLAAVKTSMLVVQRSQETLSAALQAERDHYKLEEALSSLMSCYIHILTDGRMQDSYCTHFLIMALCEFAVLSFLVKERVLSSHA